MGVVEGAPGTVRMSQSLYVYGNIRVSTLYMLYGSRTINNSGLYISYIIVTVCRVCVCVRFTSDDTQECIDRRVRRVAR